MGNAVAPPNPPHIPWTHRVIAAGTFFGVLAAFAVLVFAVGYMVTLGGCAVGYPVRADGTADLANPSIGVGVGSVNQVATGGLGLLGGLTGNPAVLMLAAVASHMIGKNKGWDEKANDDLKNRGIVATTEKTL